MLDDVYERQNSIQLKHYYSAVVAGCGGIGSWVSLLISLSGRIRKIILIDDDKIESTNLNRTPFRLKDIRKYKVDAIEELILERRVDIEIKKYRSRTNDEIISNILDDMWRGNSVLFDCRDDLYSDLNTISFNRRYKLGYDGLSITIDPHPDTTFVHGHSNSYTQDSSFLCPALGVANFAVQDAVSGNQIDDIITISYDTILNELQKKGF